MSQTIALFKSVLALKTSRVVFTLFFVFFLSLFILLPVLTITGNTLEYQLLLLWWNDYLLMAVFAVLASLNVTLQFYNFKQRRQRSDIPKSFVRSVGSGTLSIFGGILGTMKCVSCFAVLLGFLGIGSGVTFFIVKNQSIFLGAAILLLLLSLYFEATRVKKMCAQC